MSGAQRTLGVLGGMGPAAGAELLRLVTRYWPARRDQDHPRVILLSESGVPDRTDALLGRGADPTEAIHAALGRLASWGADLVAVPCNTAFAFLDPTADRLGVPVIHTVSTALAAAAGAAPHGAWLLATDGTIGSGLYQTHAAPLGYRLLLPDRAEQAAITRAVAAVKGGRIGEAAALLAGAMARLERTSPVPFLLACTELPPAWRAAGCPGRVVDSLDELALACVRSLRTGVLPVWPPAGGRIARSGAESAV